MLINFLPYFTSLSLRGQINEMLFFAKNHFPTQKLYFPMQKFLRRFPSTSSVVIPFFCFEIVEKAA